MSIGMILDYLESANDIAVGIRLLLATFFGSLIGWERVVKRHSAGIKTFALVSLGSAVATSLNVYLAMLPGLSADVSRIPAGVVSGIGFLGAGTILVTGKKQIKGLTTAASLWVTSCMGMAIGGGYLVVGIICFLLIMLANIVLMQLSKKVEEYSKYISLYIEVNKDGGVRKLTKWITTQGFSVNSMTKSKEKTLQSSDAAIIIDIDFDKKRSHQEIMAMLNELEYVSYVEEI
ncbi:putative Mg2+ transporter-C (MgtC) family protein [Butyrivibrio hungatei DSM 14810]|uniref:Putative Mg2+ transporter-C (MgtC) family protein n=1 Tax=Butyrivibrio hungatei DSM 14810 TaxID=1121132 RepID=A0A1M7RRV1_9FIRM|nr:MgtC/SapB family protein [Butyrivibrio hungatei]SHN48890.1 putative Mg2+ transporter-C (MgtC) family protein [Butyrivibrio hungatei DSM 14810]